MRAFLMLFLVGLLSFTGNAHDYYLSIAKIEYNAKSNSFEVAFKLTAHDLEHVFEEAGKAKVTGETKSRFIFSDDDVKTYFKSHFSIKVNGQELPLMYLGNEVELDETMWVYIEFPCTQKAITKIEVANTVLVDAFPKQQNHCHLKLNDKSYVEVLTREKRSKVLYERN